VGFSLNEFTLSKATSTGWIELEAWKLNKLGHLRKNMGKNLYLLFFRIFSQLTRIAGDLNSGGKMADTLVRENFLFPRGFQGFQQCSILLKIS
jgi:hypothetical protein